MMQKAKIIVPILILNYNGRQYLDDCIGSLIADVYDDLEPVIYVVDNQSTDDSAQYLRERWPEVCIFSAPSNLGFAAGNNFGWAQILKDIPEVQYLFLLNQDTVVERGFLAPLVRAFERDPRLGSAQAKLLLHPETTKVNSLGNVIHFLGFGYGSYDGVAEASAPKQDHAINYPSGAAVLLRASALREVGLFDDFMFMYLEDLDLGWRLSLAGWKNVLIASSRVYHKYQFSRSMKQYYFFERNRLWIILKNYHIATLLLLAPAWSMMELGQLLFAAINGVLPKKISSYTYFFSRKHLNMLKEDRKRTQALRKVKDRDILSTFSGVIDFQPLQNPLITYIANPVFSLYHRLIQYCIFW